MAAKSFFYPFFRDGSRVYDGDGITGVHFDLGGLKELLEGGDKDLGFNLFVEGGRLIFRKRSLRLIGIDAPEMKGKTKRERMLAVKSRDYLAERLKAATNPVVESVEKPDKNGRVLSRLHVNGPPGDIVCLNDELVAKGHAHVYDGGKKQKW